MFNFINDAASVNVDSAAGMLTVSMPRWTLLFDSDTWALIVPD